MVAIKQGDSGKAMLDDIVQNHRSKFINTGFIL
jgi:hypothetical protein